MRDERLESLLRESGAHPAAPLSEDRVASAQRQALARFAAERSAASAPRRPAVLRWLETAAVPLALGAVIYSAADWLGTLWGVAEEAVQRSSARARLEPGWLQELGAAMAERPWLVAVGALGLALLWLPPVRAALLGERD